MDKKRVRERAGSLDATHQQAKDAIARVSSGAALITTPTPKQSLLLADVTQMFRPTGLALSQVVREYLESRDILAGKGTVAVAARYYAEYLRDQEEKGKRMQINVPALAAKFLEDLKDKKKSRRYTLDVRARLNKAGKAFILET